MLLIKLLNAVQVLKEMWSSYLKMTSAYLIKRYHCIIFCKYEEGWTLKVKPVFPLSNDAWVK